MVKLAKNVVAFVVGVGLAAALYFGVVYPILSK